MVDELCVWFVGRYNPRFILNRGWKTVLLLCRSSKIIIGKWIVYQLETEGSWPLFGSSSLLSCSSFFSFFFSKNLSKHPRDWRDNMTITAGGIWREDLLMWRKWREQPSSSTIKAEQGRQVASSTTQQKDATIEHHTSTSQSQPIVATQSKRGGVNTMINCAGSSPTAVNVMLRA